MVTGGASGTQTRVRFRAHFWVQKIRVFFATDCSLRKRAVKSIVKVRPKVDTRCSPRYGISWGRGFLECRKKCQRDTQSGPKLDTRARAELVSMGRPLPTMAFVEFCIFFEKAGAFFQQCGCLGEVLCWEVGGGFARSSEPALGKLSKYFWESSEEPESCGQVLGNCCVSGRPGAPNR